MNIGELAVFLGLGAWFLSPSLFVYSLLACGTFHWFIVKVEEPRLAERFGEDYTRYKAEVNRWVPRLMRGRHGQRGTATID